MSLVTEQVPLQELKEAFPVEVRLRHTDLPLFRLGPEGHAATLAPLEAVVCLQVVDDRHVERLAFVLVAVVPATQFGKLLFRNLVEIADGLRLMLLDI